MLFIKVESVNHYFAASYRQKEFSPNKFPMNEFLDSIIICTACQ